MGGQAGPLDGVPVLRLNRFGKRYTNEGIMGYWGAGSQGARQPKGYIYSVWDSDWEKQLNSQSIDHSSVELTKGSLEGIAELLGHARENRFMELEFRGPHDKKDPAKNAIACGNTIEELADNLRLDEQVKQNFIASVERYNELCAKGRDEDYAKDTSQMLGIIKPPFYAYREGVRNVGFLMFTTSGVEVDGEQRVLDDDNMPIAGLYATGNSSGGRFPVMYTTPIPGVSIGIAATLGRIAGENASGR